MECPSCGQGKSFVKQMHIGRAPTSLCLHISRTMWLPDGTLHKSTTSVSFPSLLDLSAFMSNTQRSLDVRERERERERERVTGRDRGKGERETDRQSERQTDTERETERSETEKERDRKREREGRDRKDEGEGYSGPGFLYLCDITKYLFYSPSRSLSVRVNTSFML